MSRTSPRSRPLRVGSLGIAIFVAECAILAMAVLRADGASTVRSEVSLAERTLGRSWASEAVSRANRAFDEVTRRLPAFDPTSGRACGADPHGRLVCGEGEVFLAVFAYRALLRAAWIACGPVPLWPVFVALCVDAVCCRSQRARDPRQAILARRLVRRLYLSCSAVLVVVLQLPLALPPPVVVAAAIACLVATFPALRMRVA